MSAAISLSGVTKRFGKFTAVDRLGQVSPLPAPIRSYSGAMDVSPDGRRLAVLTHDITETALWLKATVAAMGLSLDVTVDEAVPMFFRMGRDVRPSNQPGWSYPVREPLCMSSRGVSTDEPWPVVRPDQRLYVFHPRAWSDIALKNLDTLVNP